MKVFISTDFEGTSGIVAWEQTIEGNPEYAHGRTLLTAEVNAAIDGARAAGATQIVVNDAHHDMRNLRADELAGEATLVSGRHKPLYMMQGLDGSFNAVFFVSYHGSISAETAILSHTYIPRAVYEARLDGQVVGEAALNALVAAHYGIPIVLITGDAATAQEAEWVAPTAERVVVKGSISRYAASNLHPDAARRLIRSGAQRALERLSEARAPAFARPARLDIQFLTADMAEMATWLAGVERRGPRTVALEDDDALALYKRFVTIIYLTRSLAD
jgi:D-amino peptidase